MKLSLKNLIYLPLIFFFFPGFSFQISGISRIFSVYNFTIYIAILIMCFFNDNFLSRFIDVFRKTPLKIFIYFIGFSILNSLLLSFGGQYSIQKALVNVSFRYVLVVLPVFIYILVLVTRYLRFKKFIKIFILGLWLNMVLGLIIYGSRILDIGFLNCIFDLLNNSRALATSTLGQIGNTPEYIFAQNHRLCGLYNEPGYLGRFIFLFLPFVYTFGLSKLQLFVNKNFDVLIKKTFIPLTWINLILTMSPISLVFSSSITFIYFFKQIIFCFKKYFIFFLLSLLSITLILLQIDFSDTYLARIFNVITSVNSFDSLIVIEPSLATRLVYDINTFMIFIHHPILGVGVNNIQSFIYQQSLHSPVSLTPEVIYNLNLQISNGAKVIITTPIPCFYSALAENGLFIALIFFYFIKKLFDEIHKIYKYSKNNSFKYLISKSLFYSLICLSVEFFYEGTFILSSVNFILAVSIILIYLSSEYRLKDTEAIYD